MSEFFNDTWDISMSVIPDYGIENKSANFSLANYDDKIADNFFELPNYVQGLITKYKGVETLYG